jgi:hypothetical protein
METKFQNDVPRNDSAVSAGGSGGLSGSASLIVAMLVRDPYVTATLMSRIWSRLEFCMERDQMPRDDEFLGLLTRLLYISCHSRFAFFFFVWSRVVFVFKHSVL